MAKYYRMNPYLGCKYEIPERLARRKINSKWWIPVWDDYWERFCDNAWYNIKDPERDWIFKEETKGE